MVNILISTVFLVGECVLLSMKRKESGPVLSL